MPNSGFILQLQCFEEQEAKRRGGRAYHTRAAAACARQADGDTPMLATSGGDPRGGER